jgi:two-component system, cell cycle sensor histidine kinase and response regulator CckA
MHSAMPRVAATILIVEDERIVAMDVKAMLEELGYQVPAIVANGAAAIEAVGQAQPDLVLMDIRLQGSIDGVEAAAAIRAIADVPIIFLTAHADPDTRERVRALAPYGYLIKPFDEHMLAVTLETALARYAAEQHTRESEQWLTTTIQSLRDAVVATDTEGRIMMLNPTAELLLGVTADAALGQPVAEIMVLYHPETKALLAHPILALLLRQEAVNIPPDTILRRRDGSDCRIDDSVALIRTARQTLGAVMVFRDSTPRRLAERTRDAEHRRQEEARQRERLKVLAGGIAHDLNNMLTSVIGNLSLALMDIPPTHPVTELLLHAEEGGQRAADLTRQLLAYAGRAQSHRETLDFAMLVNDIVTLLRDGPLRGVAVELALPAQPLLVNADATQLRQVVMNLLINAAEALDAAGGTICVVLAPFDPAGAVPPELELPATAAPAGYALLTVVDTGCGMDAATQARIFEPFFTTKFTGRGLGLALIQGIIHDHGGSIGVRSALGQGTTFRVLLPLLPAPPQ